MYDQGQCPHAESDVKRVQESRITETALLGPSGNQQTRHWHRNHGAGCNANQREKPESAQLPIGPCRISARGGVAGGGGRGEKQAVKAVGDGNEVLRPRKAADVCPTLQVQGYIGDGIPAEICGMCRYQGYFRRLELRNRCD